MEGFDQFWSAYPKKVAKEDSKAAWKATRKVRPPVEVILKAIRAQFATMERKYVTYPPKWIKGRRWEDEPCVADGGMRDLSEVLRREDEWKEQMGIHAH